MTPLTTSGPYARRRVACYVVREGSAGPELLVFDHVDVPDSGTQVPAGGMEGVGEDGGLLFRCWFTPLRLDRLELAGHQGEFLASALA